MKTSGAGPSTARLRLPGTVLFGAGTLVQVSDLVAQTGSRRPLVVTDSGVAATGLAERLVSDLRGAGLSAEWWSGCRPGPDDDDADRCRRRVQDGSHDGVVALGGGSVLDTAKVAAALAIHGGATRDHFGLDRVHRPGHPVVAVPTVAGSGSEISAHAVVFDRDRGKSEVVSGPPMVPRAAVVDPETTVTTPREVTLHAALDALVHAVEAFVARWGTPFTDAFVLQSVPRIVAALPVVAGGGGDPSAREELGLGCLFSSFAMANANAGAIHALGYPLSADYRLPHGLANALVAGAALERLAPSSPQRWAELARVFHRHGPPEDAGAGPERGLAERVRGFLRRLAIAPGLAAHGVAEDDLPDLARRASGFRPVLENAPALLGEEDLLGIYRSAWRESFDPGRPAVSERHAGCPSPAPCERRT